MFYNQLEDLCKKNNLTVTALLKELGLSTSKGTAWKGGSIPKYDTLKLIADYFNVSVSYLFEDEPNTKVVNTIKGNNNKNKVALLYILNSNEFEALINLDNITLFISHNYLTINNINRLKNKEIYTYGNNCIYNDKVLTIDNAIIERASKNKSIYCLAKEKNKDILEICNKKNMYVVLTNIIGNYMEIKNNLSNGSIILLNNLNNIQVITKYINSKGYEMVALSELLEE